MTHKILACMVCIQSALQFCPKLAISQVPQMMNYQAVMRDNASQLVINRSVRIRFSIISDSVNGSPIYVESHQANTTAQGLVNLSIGSGKVEIGIFSAIPWSRGRMYLKTEVDPAGGSNYVISGTTQLLSVPYALFSANVPVKKQGDTVSIGSSRLILPGSILLPDAPPPSGLSDGLVAFYPFNGNAIDASGNGNHGTVNGAVLTSDRNGISNSAYEFDGKDDFIEATVKNLPLGNSARSFSVRFSFASESTSDLACVFSYGLGLGIVDKGKLNDFFVSRLNNRIYLNNNEYGTNSYLSKGFFNEWRSVIVTYDGVSLDNIRFFVDGQLQKTENFNYQGIVRLATTNSNLYISRTSQSYGNPTTYPFKGKIDELRIYNRVLTPEEIEYLSAY